jgi:hypothetical protein
VTKIMFPNFRSQNIRRSADGGFAQWRARAAVAGGSGRLVSCADDGRCPNLFVASCL